MNADLQCGNTYELSKRLKVDLEVTHMEIESHNQKEEDESLCVVS